MARVGLPFVPESALRGLRARPRRDFRKVEIWPVEKVDSAVKTLPNVKEAMAVMARLYGLMRRSQRITFYLAAKYRRLGIYNDMGTGKTLIVLALCEFFNLTEGCERFLIGVPNRTNKEEWLRESRKWVPHLKVEALKPSLEGKIKQLEDGSALIYVDTFAGLTRLVSTKVPKRGKKAKGNQLILDPKVIKALANSFSGIIADESSFLGNHDSLQTRLFAKLAASEGMIVYLLSGTPFGRDPILLQPQLKMIDGGHTVGETLGLFRGLFYKVSKGYWSMFDYKFKKDMQPLLDRYLAHCTVRFQLDKADLPRLTWKKVFITLPAEAITYYDRARRGLQQAAIAGDLKRAKGLFHALRQISSGFLGVNLENGMEKAIIQFKENPKLEDLLDRLDTIGDHKFIIFHFFVHSGKVLSQELSKKKIKHVSINGQTKDVVKAHQAFVNDPSVRGMVLSADAGAFGLNLQGAKYGFVYESPVPVIQRKQLIRRFIRPHSEHDHVVLVDLIVRNTVDGRILEFHKSGADLFNAVIKGGVKL